MGDDGLSMTEKAPAGILSDRAPRPKELGEPCNCLKRREFLPCFPWSVNVAPAPFSTRSLG
jgi:hypothetical protein